MKNIHQIIDDEETSRMQSVEEIIETYKNGSNRMYQAVRILQKKQTKNILVTGDDGLTKDSEEQLEIITNFFEKTFNKENINKMEDVEPTKMNDSFSAEEIETVWKTSKARGLPTLMQNYWNTDQTSSTVK